ncbi:MAG: sigma 54-interacting transcriptional regulator [Planctomycetota bacterium]|jgi:Nif-specific regulatory protein
MPRIMIVKGEGKGRIFEFEEEASIGRSASNLIHLSGTQISRQHAQIQARDKGYIIRDWGSRNGILVNGKVYREVILKSGDEIQIASTIMVFDPPFRIHSVDGGARSVIFMDDQAPEGEVRAALDAADISLIWEKTPPDLEVLLRANERLKKVYEIGAAVATLLEPNDLAPRILELVIQALEADRGFILLRAKRGGDFRPAAIQMEEGHDREIALSRTILNRVVRHRKSILSADAMEDPRFRGSESVQLAQVRSVMCAPLLAREQVLGALYIDKTRPHDGFGDEDLKFLTTVAHQAAAALENARIITTARAENLELRKILRGRMKIIGPSPQMQEVLEACEKVARTDSTVLLMGETGTGKELIARHLHDRSLREEGPFVAVNCAAVPETLLESELFGHERGAFTGAHKRKRGKFELADGGTLFLDEIGEIPLSLQSKLLRALEERRYERLGGTETVSVDVRIIAASNRDLPHMARNGTFREDLYYRLAVVPITVPPLRQRPDDVEALATHFLEEFNPTIGKSVMGFSARAMDALKAHEWPGNVRELRNLVERVVVLTDKEVAGVDSLPSQVVEGEVKVQIREQVDAELSLPETVREVERLCIERALKKAGGKKIEAARLLGISRPTLDKKMKAFGLDKS